MNKGNPSIDYEDLESEFDYANDAGSSIDRGRGCRIRNDELWKKPQFGETALPDRKKAKGVFDKEQSCFERRKQRLMTLDVYTRHKELINQYYLCYPGATAKLQRDTSRDRTDYEVLKDNHRFLWNDDELMKAAEKSWEARLAKRYYDKLFKEYCIADFSQYKKNRIAMRWRTEREVRSGKGQFECGNKRCTEKDDLSSWELRLCPECSKMLNYHSQKKKLGKKDKRRNINKKTLSNARSRNEEFPEADASEIQKSEISKEIPKEVEQNIDEKIEKDNLMEIWRKSPEDNDPEKVAEQELDDFLDDLLL
ncbi:Folate-sensitive fragile site protein Fra10Ac1 family protein [Acanthocheilonema viteae]